jgi:hypothetical protein
MNQISPERFVRILVVCAILFSLFELLPAIYTSQTTGVLQLTSSTKQTYLTIDQPGRQAITINTTSARLRLKPGTYQVTATSGLSQVTKNVVVRNKKLTKMTLTPVDLNSVPKTYLIANRLIEQLLPFTGSNFEYQVGYEYQFSNTVAKPIITITAPTAQNQQAAVAWIKSQGYNTSSLNIIYILAQP